MAIDGCRLLRDIAKLCSTFKLQMIGSRKHILDAENGAHANLVNFLPLS